MDAAGKKRAADYLVEQMAHRGMSAALLAGRAGVDEGTVRSLANGERWPWATKRTAIEQALGLPSGSLELVARGLLEPREDDDADPVETAIRKSRLNRANQHKLIGSYYAMLDEQDGGEVRGA